ncbi:MAG TPA: thioredoxin domain-containing protein [Solirubrobacterales bacterium]|nr:thioredoxin domain-containing protein [Solirubrobacterales bacterium]
MSEAAATRAPRRGRLLVAFALGVAIFGLGFALVEISTKEAGREVVLVDGISAAQRTFAGVPQEGDRLGSADAPVTVQVFNDLQCGTCAEAFVGTIPPLVERYARPGDVKLLIRHYSFARNELQLGFFAAEAAARQNYGWQYTYLFFRNQDEAERFGVEDQLLESIAASVGEIDLDEWREDLERESGEGGEIRTRLEGYEELGAGLGIRAEPAAIVSGPRGTRTLQETPTLAEIERAIEAVR